MTKKQHAGIKPMATGTHQTNLGPKAEANYFQPLEPKQGTTNGKI